MQKITVVLLAACVVLLAGCNLPKVPSPTPSKSAVPASPTPTQTTIPPTHTPPPTETQPPPTETLDPNADHVPGLDIIIEGSSEFREQTIRSLLMYQQCAPEALAEADLYLEKIMEYDRSGMDVYSGTFQAALPTAFVEGYVLEVQVYWFGGSIIHDARHRWQHLNGINTNWSELDIAGREYIENDARGVQIDAMDACLGSVSAENLYQAEHLLNYLKDMQSGKTPCDYCKVDYSERDW